MTETGQVVPKKPKKAEWFDEDSEKTTKVYVTGLPDGKAENWDEEEFTKYMSKCGVVDIDVRTNKPKVKLYKDDDGNYKGMGSLYTGTKKYWHPYLINTIKMR